VAVLTYIGFDGISTLSERSTIQAEHLSGYGICLRDHGILAAAEVYGSIVSFQKFGTDFGVFSQFGDENVFSHVAGIAGGFS